MSGARVRKRTVLLGSALCLVVGLLVLPAATGSTAVPTKYYVDSTAACPGSGTQASPWCDFTVVNSKVFQPGDQVLLKSGDTFTTPMVLSGSGTSSSYITVAPYGSGAAPIINGNGNLNFVAIDLNNDSYVDVQGLSIENSESGILINDTTNQTGYRFLDLTLSGNSSGIQSPSGTNAGIASDVLVQDVTGADNQLSCPGTCSGTTLLLGNVSHVLVDRLNSYTNCGESAWGLASGASDVVIENSESQNDADCHKLGGTTANFLDNVTNITFVNDIVADVPQQGEVDLSGIDLEPQDGPDTGVSVEDDYIANNAGPGIQILDHPDPITNVTISGNVLSNNGAEYQRSWKNPVWGQIWTSEWLANFVEATGSITNNLYNAPTGTGGFEVAWASANFNEITQSNNIDVSGAGAVSYAANGFSCTTQGANQWSYQSSANNTTWTNFSGCAYVNALDQEWSGGGPSSGFVSNFEELPPSTSTGWVARSWTAPSPGSVSIRGRVLMSDPTCASGAKAEITKNGSSTPLWGPQSIAAGDNVGVNADLDGVSVKTGDVLHFAVQENGSAQCRVSWTPSVGYPNPVTTVSVPTAGAQVAGTQALDASASDFAAPISNVQYLLTGGSLNQAVIDTVTTPTVYGWVGSFQTAGVRTGTYTLQSMVTDANGNVAYSPGVTIKVQNIPATAVLDPSTGASVSGSNVVLDASASDLSKITKVTFQLTGGSLHAAPIATASPTLYGWIATWNSTTVPNGTYKLRSQATDAAGVKGLSPPITVKVAN
jgi:hypothetical protein